MFVADGGADRQRNTLSDETLQRGKTLPWITGKPPPTRVALRHWWFFLSSGALRVQFITCRNTACISSRYRWRCKLIVES
jgi:hypothetical protein